MSTTQLTIKHHPPDLSLLTGLSWGGVSLPHDELSTYLADKQPYTVTIILDNLAAEVRNNKAFVTKTKHEKMSLYHELIFKKFDGEYGNKDGNELYGQWLDKYRQQWLNDGQKKILDDYIMEYELEPRYKKVVESRFKNLEKLHQSRTYTSRERKYQLPSPITHVDWRSPYDTLFIWTENNQKLVTRGGSGSSGARETNSRFIFALGLLNQKQPVTSHLFLYDKLNQLHQLQTFLSLTVPRSDIGENYHLDQDGHKQAMNGVQLLWWETYYELTKLSLNDPEEE